MGENVPVAAQHFNAVFPAILSVYCAAIAFNFFDKMVAACTFGRGLHSSTFQLNLSALYGRGGARRGCVARVKGVLGGV